MFSIISTCFTLIFFKSNKYLPYFNFLFLFFSLGTLIIQEKQNSQLKLNFKKHYIKESAYQIHIQEISNNNREWKKVIAKITLLKTNDDVYPCDESIVLFIQTHRDSLHIGDDLILSTKLNEIKNKGNPGEFDAEYFWMSKNIKYIGFVKNQSFIKKGNSISPLLYWTQISRNYFSNILNSHFKGQELAIAQALILGDRGYLSTETTTSFGNSGAMHVLAVSGLHIGIILQIILISLKAFSKFITKKKVLAFAIILIWIYTILSGLSASVLRATFMFSVLAISQIYGRNNNPINNLFFTGFILLIINPLYILDIGFQLSYLAMIGIFWFYKPISKLFYIQNKWFRKIWEGTAVGLAAQITTLPLTLYYFHQFPNYFILTNIGLMLSTGLILGLGLFIFGFYWINFLGKIAVFLLTVTLIFTLNFVKFIDQLPGSIANGFSLSKWEVLIAFLLIIGFYILKSYRYTWLILIPITILVSQVTYTRFENLNHNEICFMNHSKLTIILKNNNNIFCFYDAETNNLKKIKFIAESYQKLYPGKLQYHSIKNRDWKLNSKNLVLTIKKLKQGRLISLNNSSYYIKKYENDTTNNLNSKVILMPWLKKEYWYEHPLQHGGIQFKI